MCGIIGFTGKTEAVPKLLDGLERLEYRGYDSAAVSYTHLVIECHQSAVKAKHNGKWSGD